MALAPDPALTNGTTDATPAPQPTPAQPQAGMPGQAASQAITPAASAPAQVTQPQAAATAQAAAVPSTEATINAASTGRGATGILRGILVGALKGASAHLVGTPQGSSASAPSTQPARQGGVVSAIGQGLKKVGQGVGHEASTFLKAQPEYQERMKDAQDMQIKANLATLQAHHMMLENQELTGKVADEEQARTDKKTADQKAQQDAWQGLHDQFEKEGIKADYAHGPGHDNMGQSHAANAAAGTTVHAYNGETGADAGVDIYNVQELQSSPLTADFSTPSTFDIDPKTGDIINVKNQTLPAGSTTAWQAHQFVQDYSARVAKAQADWSAGQKRRLEAATADDKQREAGARKTPEQVAAESAADVKQKNASANKDNADAAKLAADKKRADAANALGDTNLTGEAYLNSLPKDHQALVKQIASGQVPLPTIQRLLTKEPGLVSEVALYDPNFDVPTLGRYAQEAQQYTPGGKVGTQIVQANTALEHLAELQKWNNTPGAFIKGTAAYSAREGALTDASQELAKFLHGGSSVEAVAEVRKSLNPTGYLGEITPGTRQAAAKEQAKLINEKVRTFQTGWDQNLPSEKWKASHPNPTLTTTARNAYEEVTGDKGGYAGGASIRGAQPAQSAQAPKVPAGATHTVPGSDGRMYYTNAQGQNLGPVQQ